MGIDPSLYQKRKKKGKYTLKISLNARKLSGYVKFSIRAYRI